MQEDAATQRDLARQLLAAEGASDSDPLLTACALDRIHIKLHDQLAPVMGERGIRAVVARAVRITRAGFPFLAADPIPGDDEYLKGLRASLREQEPAMAEEAATTLLANTLSVLLGLLGDNLTYGFVRAAWPDMEIP